MSSNDYVSLSSRRVSFNAGDTNHILTLSITNDELCENSNDNFSVNIAVVSGVQPITISPSRAQVVINDEDEPECSK